MPSGEGTARSLSGGMRVIALVVFVLLLVLLGSILALFAAQNSHWVILRVPALRAQLSDPFYVLEYEAPLSAVMAAAFVVGGLLVWLLHVPGFLRRAVQRSRDRRFIDALQGELVDLRNLPVDAPAPLEDLRELPGPATKTTKPASSGDDDEAALIAALQQSPPPHPKALNR